MSREWVRRHQRLKEVIDSSKGSCIDVNKLAKKLDIDPRTARAHLEVMELDRVGAFIGDNKSVFCQPEAIEGLAKRYGELAKKLRPKEE